MVEFSIQRKVPHIQLQRLLNYWPIEEVTNDLIIKKENINEEPVIEIKSLEATVNEVDFQNIKRQLEKSTKSTIDEYKKSWDIAARDINKKIEAFNEYTEKISLFESKAAKLNEKTLRHENEIVKIRAEIRNQIKDSNQELKSEIKDLNESLNKLVSKKMQDLFTTVNGRLDDIILAVNTQSKYINNSEAKLSFNDERKRNVVKQEEIFVNAWVEFLNDDCNINISGDDAMFYHSIFKTCRLLVVENEAVLDSWIKFLGFHELTNIESAGPLWHSRMDWYGTSKYLETPSDKPRLAIIRNFNTGITNSYLYPVLDRWRVSGISKSQKLFLVPSMNSDEISGYTELLGIVPVLKNDFRMLTSDGSWVKHHQINLQNNLPSINKPTFESWIKECNLSENRRELLDTPCRILGIKLPDSLLHSYNELLANLTKYFSPRDSALAAIELSFKPYIVTIHGEDKYERYAELIQAFL